MYNKLKVAVKYKYNPTQYQRSFLRTPYTLYPARTQARQTRKAEIHAMLLKLLCQIEPSQNFGLPTIRPRAAPLFNDHRAASPVAILAHPRGSDVLSAHWSGGPANFGV